MSRHIILQTPEREVVCGYDPPMESYFAIETDETPDPKHEREDDVIWWVGMGNKEIPTIEGLIEAVEAHGRTIPLEMIKPLVRDKDESEPPSPLQIKMREMFG